MSPTSVPCPACATSDRTVPVSVAVLGGDTPLDPAVRAQLDVPREPKSLSPGSTVLFVLAGLQLLPLLMVLGGIGDPDPTVRNFSLIATLLVLALGIGFATAGRLVLNAARARRRAQGGWPLSYDQWTLVHKVWRAAWLCRACQVAFFPAWSLRPDFPASPALQLPHFQDWLTETSKQIDLAGGLATTAP
ncbi:hypothetical protein ACIQBJ_15620 [Kitasatospora sp. NPDC088391]|uniref:hypothetical protein n=1 Tax=Kitasatospora sp. NPDC088391 TaxID=3364074 RepID=UPI0038019065